MRHCEFCDREVLHFGLQKGFWESLYWFNGRNRWGPGWFILQMLKQIFKRNFLSYLKAGKTTFVWPLAGFSHDGQIPDITIASSFLPLFHNVLSHLCSFWLTSFILAIRNVSVAWVPCGWWKYYAVSCHLPQGARRLRNFWTIWSSRLDCPWLGERKRTSGMKPHFSAPFRIFTWKRKRPWERVLCCRSCTFLMNLEMLFILLALYRKKSWRKSAFLCDYSC